MNGGIPKRDVDALMHYWDVFTDTREALFKQNGISDYLFARVQSDHVKSTLMDSVEYLKYSQMVEGALATWKQKYKRYLKSLEQNCKPKDVIREISEDILATFLCIPLIDEYNVYQSLMNYWSEVMQDDVYLISGEGWKDAAKIRPIIDEKDKRINEKPDIVIGSGKKAQKFKAELIPPILIVQNFYADEKQAIVELEAQREAVAQEIKELTERDSSEEGFLEDAMNGKGKLTITILKNHIKKLDSDEHLENEMVVLHQAQKLLDNESALASKIKSLQMELDKDTIAHYSKLDVDEIKELVVTSKWFVQISNDVAAEVERVIHALSNRVRELEERYAHPMPEITKQVSEYSERVEKHLKKMGLSW